MNQIANLVIAVLPHYRWPRYETTNLDPYENSHNFIKFVIHVPKVPNTNL
jgi:hypothetical protein